MSISTISTFAGGTSKVFGVPVGAFVGIIKVNGTEVSVLSRSPGEVVLVNVPPIGAVVEITFNGYQHPK